MSADITAASHRLKRWHWLADIIGWLRPLIAPSGEVQFYDIQVVMKKFKNDWKTKKRFKMWCKVSSLRDQKRSNKDLTQHLAASSGWKVTTLIWRWSVMVFVDVQQQGSCFFRRAMGWKDKTMLKLTKIGMEIIGKEFWNVWVQKVCTGRRMKDSSWCASAMCLIC